MKKLQLNEVTALKLYPDAPDYFKKILEETFTKEFFEIDVTERIKTLQDVYAFHGVKESDFKNLSPWLKSCNDLDLWITCVNEGYIPDWTDHNEKKWFLWFKQEANSPGWCFGDVTCSPSGSLASSRLVFKSQELADKMSKNAEYMEIHKTFLSK